MSDPGEAASGYDVFLSYGTPDREWVRGLKAELEKLDLKVFQDERRSETRRQLGPRPQRGYAPQPIDGAGALGRDAPPQVGRAGVDLVPRRPWRRPPAGSCRY